MILPFPLPLLESGLIVGHTTSTTSRLWVRAVGGASLRVGTRHIEVATDPAADHTAVVELTGLRPGTITEVALGTVTGQIRTPAVADRLCFAFVSCHLPFAEKHGQVAIEDTVDMLDALREVVIERGAAFVLHLGDQVYADPELAPSLDVWRAARRGGEPLALYRELHRAYWALPAMRRLHPSVPNVMIWDDGETHDAFGSVAIADPDAPSMIAAARQAFVEYQRAHGPPLVASGTFASRFDLGPASFFVLDLRAARDHAARRLLGEEQWRAFDDWLVATDARPIRFVASSVPLLHTPDSLVRKVTESSRAPAAFLDRWSAEPFHHELVRMLEALRGRRVVVLAGDIHIGAAMELLEERIPQWVSSAVTHKCPLVHRLESEAMSRLAPLVGPWPIAAHFHELRNNFGIVEVEGERARFELWVRRDSGGAKKLYECTTPW